jgi:hypothetical protein
MAGMIGGPEHVTLTPYDPAAHPDEELIEMDPSVVLPKGAVLAPGVKVYVRLPKRSADPEG